MALSAVLFPMRAVSLSSRESQSPPAPQPGMCPPHAAWAPARLQACRLGGHSGELDFLRTQEHVECGRSAGKWLMTRALIDLNFGHMSQRAGCQLN